MAISDAIIKMARFGPELLPDAWVGNVPALGEVVPAVLDLKRFAPWLVSLTGIQAFPSANVVQRTRYDDIRLEESTIAMPLNTVPPVRLTGVIAGGPFSPGEGLTGGVSGATGILYAQGANWIEVVVFTGVFIAADVVAGVVSAATIGPPVAVEGAPGHVPALPGAWFLTAKQYLYLNFQGVLGFTGYPALYSVWAQKPTVAHKLVHGISLTTEERAISEKFGVASTVEKGLLPLPLSQQIEREYYVLGEETRSRVVTMALAATDYAIENIYARANEIIVLTRIAAISSVPPGLVADGIQLIVDRDDDHNYVTIPTYPMSTLAGGEISCFIPAIHEIRLHTTATVAPFPQLFRYTIRRVKLSNILRARFGLASKDELPGDTWDKVASGIL